MFDHAFMDEFSTGQPAEDGLQSSPLAQTQHFLSVARRTRLPLPSAVAKATGHEMLRGRLLYVEDNVRIAEITEMMLDDLGLCVTWVPSAEVALQQLDSVEEPFDLVFTDVVMPGMSGVELAKRIEEYWPDLPVILTSGFSHELAQGQGSEYELLPKPFTRLALIQCLLRYLPTAY
jgi:CheY-like chemotaxis protein